MCWVICVEYILHLSDSEPEPECGCAVEPSAKHSHPASQSVVCAVCGRSVYSTEEKNISWDNMRDMWQSQILLKSCRKSIHFGFPETFIFFFFSRLEAGGEVEFLQRQHDSPARTNRSHHRQTVPAERIKWRMLCAVYKQKCAERKACACSFRALFSVQCIFYVVCFHTVSAHPFAWTERNSFIVCSVLFAESQWAFRIRAAINEKHMTMDYRIWVYRYRCRRFYGAK